jgi:hypothetical protein
MKYKWRNQGVSGVRAHTVGKELTRLIEKSGGEIQPVAVVNAAKSKTSPLHPCFDWNDKSAAEKYRQDQARYLLRQIVVVQDSDDRAEPVMVRAFVSVPGEREGLIYTTVQRAAQSDSKWDYVVQTAHEELLAWRNKYKTLTEFKKVFAAIDQIKIS